MVENFEKFLEIAKQIVANHKEEYKGTYYMKGGALGQVLNIAKGSIGLNGFTGLRDSAETLGSLAGNYFLPGSSIVTAPLTSKGAQENLNSGIGKLAQLGTGLSGSGVGSSFTGIPSASASGAGWSNLLNGAGNATGLTGENSVLGTSAGTPLAGSVGPTQGSGVLGSATRGISDLGSALSTGTGGGSSSFGSSAGGIGQLLGGVNSLYANKKAQDDLVNAENKSINQLQPYLNSGQASNAKLSELLGTGGDSTASDYGTLNKPFTPGDLTQDPGYQFQLQQGTQALDRKQAATGNYFSGSALKAAQDYGTGLADSTYQQAYNRDLQNKQNLYNQYAGQNATGLSAANSAGNLYSGIGNAQAAAGIQGSNILNQSLSGLLSGSGAKKPTLVNGQVVLL